MAWEYSEKTRQLFQDALTGKAGTHMGEIKDADAIGIDGSIVCGDAMKIYFNVDKNESDPRQDSINKIKYQTFGCTSAIAASEALCSIIEARKCTPIESLKITNNEIVDFLGGLPEQKIHCSVMGAQAMREAVKDWAKKRNVNLSEFENLMEEQDEGRIICDCFALSEPYLERKIKEMNLKTVDQVKNSLKAGGACQSCIERPGGIRDLLTKIWGKEDQSCKSNTSTPCNYEERINKVIEETIRPELKLHNGGITVVEIKEDKVYCVLEGACSNCSGAKFTLKNLVEKQLKELVDEKITVIDV